MLVTAVKKCHMILILNASVVGRYLSSFNKINCHLSVSNVNCQVNLSKHVKDAKMRLCL